MDIAKLQEKTLDQCQAYYDEMSIWMGKQGFIWLKNDETGQLMLYTRGEYSPQILDFIKTLK